MTPTSFEDLYSDCSDATSDAYLNARARKVAEIADEIRGSLESPDLAEVLAETMMSEAEAHRRISGDSVSGEIGSQYTRSGNPLSLSV